MNQTILIGLVSLLASPLFAQQATSPDGKWVVFVKPGHGPAIETGSGPTEPKELLQRDLQQSRRERLFDEPRTIRVELSEHS